MVQYGRTISAWSHPQKPMHIARLVKIKILSGCPAVAEQRVPPQNYWATSLLDFPYARCIGSLYKQTVQRNAPGMHELNAQILQLPTMQSIPNYTNVFSTLYTPPYPKHNKNSFHFLSSIRCLTKVS